MTEALNIYHEQLRRRRHNIMSDLDDPTSWEETKPHFYADSRLLGEDALESFKEFITTYPPYGLVEPSGEALTSLQDSPGDKWFRLTQALRMTGIVAVERATPRITECPYHEMLAQKIGGSVVALTPYDHNKRGIDTLRDVVAPGASLNASLFTSFIRRMPFLQRLHGSDSELVGFSKRSVGLLREPLGHPQQYAVGFVFSLGGLRELVHPTRFLNDDLARKYTRLAGSIGQQDRLEWAIPTEDFVLRGPVDVVSRTIGSERDATEDTTKTYPAGTRLGDIEVDEPTIGCPGNQLAFGMWNRVIEVAVAEGLWEEDRMLVDARLE